MAGLNVSLCFFFIIVTLCEGARRLSKMFLPQNIYSSFAGELASALQLCACCLELRMLVEIGLWGGGFGPDVVLTLLFLLFLVHGLSFDGASANPAVSIQEFLMMESSLLVTAVKLSAHFMGMKASCVLTNLYWSWELTDFHLIQNLIARDCSSSLRTSVGQGTLVEATCSFFFHLTLLQFQHSLFIYRVTAQALVVTILAYTAGPFTSAFFNPALAFSVTFHCSGNTFLDYMQVYCLGPLAGMVVAILLYQGNIPRFFQRNLFYYQKSKYRVPKGKPASTPNGMQKQEKNTKRRKVESNQKME
ncbi:aquaporin-12-like [Gracilinanus agilis]|uniref:aquaporin-12-like n=1 Tax=Gracilinanus agilis TaxID=191870 RepID=UPI001CFE86EA|nr:aquaporin-12-like [Gracilinanus agilis]